LRQRALATVRTRANVLSAARVVLAFAGFAALLLMVWGPLELRPHAPVLLGIALVAFAIVAVVHGNVLVRADKAAAAVEFYQLGLLRAAGKFRETTLAAHTDPGAEHPFADDLDLFGHGSLWHRLNLTSTRYGSLALQRLLTGGHAEFARGDLQSQIVARQTAVAELAPLIDLREALYVAAVRIRRDAPDPDAFVAWVDTAPRWTGQGTMAVVGAMVAITTCACALLGKVGILPSYAPAIFAYVAGIALLVALRAQTAPSLAAASKERALTAFSDLFAAIERQTFRGELLKAAASKLQDARAADAMRALSRVVGFVEARESGFFRIFLAPILLWDLQCAAALERWRANVKGLASWFQVLGEVEALASLASFAFEEPGYVYPEFSSMQPSGDALPAGIHAIALAHPLVTAAVANDVAMAAGGHILLITGSNMAGKSTLLRTIGVNVVLAHAGAPVRAESLTLPPLRLATSIRVRDSLEGGVSRFYAELRKLKVAQDLALQSSNASAEPQHAGALVLLDEILAGTNLRERLLGARALIRTLLEAGAFAVVTTHDLELVQLGQAGADQASSRVVNAHFLEQVEGEVMTFDYRLRPGVVTSSNALRLMRSLGLRVPLSPTELPIKSSSDAAP
jgi:MutS domain V